MLGTALLRRKAAAGGGGGAGLTFGTAATSFNAGSYPTSGTLSFNCGGSTCLLVAIYVNDVLTGPDLTCTYAGAAMTNIGTYTRVGGMGYFTAFYKNSPAAGANNIDYSQSSGNFNSARIVVAVPVSGAATTPVSSMVGSTFTGASGSTTVFTASPPASGDHTLGVIFHRFPTNVPTINTSGTTAVASNSAASDAKGIAVRKAGQVGLAYNVDDFNHATAIALGIVAA